MTEEWIKLAAAEYLVGPNRCPICGWMLAKTVEEGCVIGNCSQRSDQQEQNTRMRARQADFSRLTEIMSRWHRSGLCEHAPYQVEEKKS